MKLHAYFLEGKFRVQTEASKLVVAYTNIRRLLRR